jgi:outer membrane protein OmpA-like peptidoglycan-associated protein
MRTAAHQAARATAPAATRAVIQRKARIGPVDDPLEREADRIADVVLAGKPIGAINGTTSNAPQRKCAQCEEEEKALQRKCAHCSAEEEAHGDMAETAARAVSQGGAPLTTEQRAYFEPRFGRDFSNVRIHSSSEAGRAATSINARAYTVGSHIAFATGGCAAHSAAADRLLAHELTHVVQQQGSAVPMIRRQPTDEEPAAEPELDPKARRAAEIAASKTSPGGVHGSLRPFHIVLDNFAIDSAVLKAEHSETLAEIVDMVKSAPKGNLRLEIGGHTDDTGDDPRNNRLSRQRALAVQRMLRRAGVDVVAMGFGEREPAAGNDTEERRSRNRRVEIRFLPGPNVVIKVTEPTPNQPAPTPVEPDRPPEIKPPEQKKPPEKKVEPPEQKKPPEPPEEKPEEEEEEDEDWCDRHPRICKAIGIGVGVGTIVGVGVGIGIGIRACLSNPLACLGPLLPELPGGDDDGKEPPEDEEPEDEKPPPHACPIDVRLPRGVVRAKPIITGSHYELRAGFKMEIDFENDPDKGCDCSRGEYLQEIRGWAQVDSGGSGWRPLPTIPLTATGQQIHPSNFQEDGPDPYGHRYRGAKRTQGRLRQQIAEDRFDPDRATGCFYRGYDRAGFNLDDPAPGHYRFHLWFRGAPVDGVLARTRVEPWREWEAVGDMDVPEPPSPTPDPVTPTPGIKRTRPKPATGTLPGGNEIFLLYESGLSRSLFYADDGTPYAFMEGLEWPIVIRFESEGEIFTTTIQVKIARITPSIVEFFASTPVTLNIAPDGHRPIVVRPGAPGAVLRRGLD